jgi:hypothetical protein
MQTRSATELILIWGLLPEELRGDEHS